MAGANWKSLKGERVINLLQKRYNELTERYWVVRGEWTVLEKAKQQLAKDIAVYQKALGLTSE